MKKQSCYLLLALLFAMPATLVAQFSSGTVPGTLVSSNSSVGIGAPIPYSESRLHIKSPNANAWGFVTEASSSRRLIALGHDGNAGFISTSFLESGSHTPLNFNTSNLTRMTITESGNIGMGTTSPYSASRLHIKANGSNVWGFVSEAAANQKLVAVGHDGNAGFVSVSFLGASEYSPLNFNTSNLTRMTITAGGNVGIGTTTTGSFKLAVEGKIGAREINVLTGPWPDYVFEKNYNLRPLAEVENYINQNKHLPEVPAGKEMEANGVNLGEMNMLLLKKVEELTLYVIELKKENEAQRKQNEIQQEEIDLLKGKKK